MSFDYDVFVSYRWVEPDQTWVRNELVPALSAAGLKVCLDVEDFIPGRDLILEMSRAGKQSRRAICVLSPDYFEGNRFVSFEGLMLRREDPSAQDSRLIPIILRKCTVPEWLSGLIAVDWTTPRNHRREWAKLLIALGATREAKEPAPVVGELREDKPQTPDGHLTDDEVARAEAEVVRSLEASFPPGLYLIDYVPGVRFKIREQVLTTLFDRKLPSDVFYIVVTLLFLSGALSSNFSPMMLAITSPLVIWFWARRKLLGNVVKVNIRNRTCFGDGGLGWPPNIRTVINADPSTGKWKTSLFLSDVQIYSVFTPTSEGGRKTIEPFLNALQKLSALRRTKKLGFFTLLSDLFY
jgi:hypothetical protein